MNNPNLPVPSGAPPTGAPPQASPQMGAEGKMNPEELRRMLVEAITKMKAIAQQNGIDFATILSEVA